MFPFLIDPGSKITMSTEIRHIVGRKLTKKDYILRPIASVVLTGFALVGSAPNHANAIEVPHSERNTMRVFEEEEMGTASSYGPKEPGEIENLHAVEMQAQMEIALGFEEAEGQKERAELEVTPQQASVSAQSFSEVHSLGKVKVEDGSDVWTVLADCETGDGEVGAPYYVTWDSNGDFEGGFQFLNSTWRSLKASAGYEHAYQAPPEIQLQAAEELQIRGGWGQWPSCTERMIGEGYIK